MKIRFTQVPGTTRYQAEINTWGAHTRFVRPWTGAQVEKDVKSICLDRESLLLLFLSACFYQCFEEFGQVRTFGKEVCAEYVIDSVMGVEFIVTVSSTWCTNVSRILPPVFFESKRPAGAQRRRGAAACTLQMPRLFRLALVPGATAVRFCQLIMNNHGTSVVKNDVRRRHCRVHVRTYVRTYVLLFYFLQGLEGAGDALLMAAVFFVAAARVGLAVWEKGSFGMFFT